MGLRLDIGLELILNFTLATSLELIIIVGFVWEPLLE